MYPVNLTKFIDRHSLVPSTCVQPISGARCRTWGFLQRRVNPISQTIAKSTLKSENSLKIYLNIWKSLTKSELKKCWWYAHLRKISDLRKKNSKITPTLRKICLLVPFSDNNSINLRNLRVEKISALLAPRPVETWNKIHNAVLKENIKQQQFPLIQVYLSPVSTMTISTCTYNRSWYYTCLSLHILFCHVSR